MKKTIAVAISLLCLLSSGIADAGVRLKGKSIYDVHKYITCTNGTNEQTMGDKIKITTVSPITGIDFSGKIGVKPSDPKSDMYYFRVSGIGHADNVYGIKGVTLKLENLTDNVLIIHWNESAIQIGNTSSVPFINGMKYISAGKPSETPNTIIPPKTFANVDVYPAVNVKYDSMLDWHIFIEPIHTDGSTQAVVTMKVEEDGAAKYYSYKSPYMNFPETFLAQYRYDK